jgi:hypothetical protein
LLNQRVDQWIEIEVGLAAQRLDAENADRIFYIISLAFWPSSFHLGSSGSEQV